MVMEQDDGREIRIERDFLKKQDGVKIYDNVTGEDITALYPYDNVTRQNLPLGDLKINSVVYNNTVNIKQMASASDADLAKEVNDRLIELGTPRRRRFRSTVSWVILKTRKNPSATTDRASPTTGCCAGA